MAKYTPDKKVNGLRKYTDHGKGYYLHYKIDGQSSFRDKKIAPLDTPIISVRNKAKRMLGLAVQGIDPFEPKVEETFEDIFLVHVKKLERKGAKRIDALWFNYNKDIKSAIGKKKVNEITENDIAKLHNKVTERAPVVANRCLEIIKAVFNTSKIRPNPAEDIEKNPEIARKRYMTQAELQAVVRELNKKDQDPKCKESVSFIWLLIFTGARLSEIANAKWENFDGHKLVIKEHKTDRFGEDRVIYLNDQAIGIINKLEKKGEHILGIKNPTKLWQGVRKRANCNDLRLHDLRHSMASFSNVVGMNLTEIGNLLGHKDHKSTQRYAHIHEEQSMENINKVGSHIQSIIMRSVK